MCNLDRGRKNIAIKKKVKNEQNSSKLRFYCSLLFIDFVYCKLCKLNLLSFK